MECWFIEEVANLKKYILKPLFHFPIIHYSNIPIVAKPPSSGGIMVGEPLCDVKE